MLRFLPVLLLVGACSSNVAYFKPDSNVRNERGRPLSAAYNMSAGSGSDGIARIWSRGVFVTRGQTVAHVAVEMESDGNAPMSLLVQSLRLHLQKGKRQLELKATEVRGTSDVPPRGFGRVDLFFLLPEGMAPRAVKGFELNWHAKIGGEELRKSTAFVRSPFKGKQTGLYVGGTLPGLGTQSPSGTWFVCPGDDSTYYTSPPECGDE